MKGGFVSSNRYYVNSIVNPEPPRRGENFIVYIYRPTQTQPDPKAFCINIHTKLHKYARNEHKMIKYPEETLKSNE